MKITDTYEIGENRISDPSFPGQKALPTSPQRNVMVGPCRVNSGAFSFTRISGLLEHTITWRFTMSPVRTHENTLVANMKSARTELATLRLVDIWYYLLGYRVATVVTQHCPLACSVT